MSEAPQFVSPPDLEALLSPLERMPDAGRAGLFGPGSVTWKLNRESALFLGAGRAALLQLAHPWVAASLVHHSNLRNDPIGRFHSTFRVIYTMLFGTRAQALAASRHLYRRHTTIRGELPTSVGAHRAHEHYEANEVAALRWVYATLVESAVIAYEFAIKPLTIAERDAYYAESKIMAALFGIPSQALPADWAAFAKYNAAMHESPQLGADADARSLAASVLSGVGTWVRPPRWYRALTAWWIPARLRTELGMEFGSEDEAMVSSAARWLPRVYAHLPHAIRYVGPYHEAAARLRRRQPGPLTRRSNRFWMGRTSLLFPELAA